MELLKFDRAPETPNQEHIIAMLETVLEHARNGDVQLLVMVTADADYTVSVGHVVDSPLEAAGLLHEALQTY